MEEWSQACKGRSDRCAPTQPSPRSAIAPAFPRKTGRSNERRRAQASALPSGRGTGELLAAAPTGEKRDFITVYQIVQFRNRAGSVNIIPLNVSDTRNFRYNWMCCHRFYRLKGQVAQPDHHNAKRLRLKSVPSYVRHQLRRSWGAPQHTGLRRHADARGDTGLASPVGVKSVVLSRTR